MGKGGRQKAQDKAQALTTAPVTGRLLRHLPYTLASLLFSAFYNVADTLFVSHGVGDLAAAGISVVFPLTVLQGAIAQMVGAGAGALVSPCLGQKDYRAAGRVTKSAMAFFYTTALGITCICLLFRTPLLRLFGATAEILPYARTYYTQAGVSFPPYGKNKKVLTILLRRCIFVILIIERKNGENRQVENNDDGRNKKE